MPVIQGVRRGRGYRLSVDAGLVREIDKIVKGRGFFRSREEFVHDSIRSRILEIKHVLLEERGLDESEDDEETLEQEIHDRLLKELDAKKYTGVH